MYQPRHQGRITKGSDRRKEAVLSGYWHLFRYNPALRLEGKNPYSLDSKKPTADYKDFIMNEVRYSKLARSNADRAEELFDKAAKAAADKYEHLVRLQELYEPLGE